MKIREVAPFGACLVALLGALGLYLYALTRAGVLAWGRADALDALAIVAGVIAVFLLVALETEPKRRVKR